MSERIGLVVDDDVPEMLTALAGGERRRGQWVSDLVRAMHENQEKVTASNIDELRLTVAGLIGEVKMLNARVTGIETEIRRALHEAGILPGPNL